MKVDVYVEDAFGDLANVFVSEAKDALVSLDVDENNMVFTPEQARELAAALIEAAEEVEG